ncbi:DUF4293 domain-containing protein [Prevotella sp. OH937_COT-195]|uniref:DUF4293 domain-containing protein n=1 Tax=Prevotella sp. OH937_COT-195 TaxID=2491051 RepID=UPI000F653AD7|nr:DUF4293 domain-containing protein [Prevotella sp. OH937_COT-195]RRD03015.1 DUF4293 family protein [Prevotella sp. OH937_COT-195]
MLQRKQTVFLLLALVLTMICLCLPVGLFYQEGMQPSSLMLNLWVKMPDGSHDYSVWPMFALLLLSCPIMVTAILTYKNRMFQSRMCVISMLLMLAWYAAYAMFGFVVPCVGGASFTPSIATALPLVNMILLFFARRGILADEAMVRAADRIR